MTNQEKWTELKMLLEEIRAYERCVRRVDFDMRCCAPQEGVEQAGKEATVLYARIHQLTHAPRYQELIRELHADSDGLTQVQRRAIELLHAQYLREKNISEEFAKEIDLAISKSYSDWLIAKRESDFSKFRDSFAAVVANTKKAVLLRDEAKGTIYDTLLDDMEKGGSIAQLDAFFSRIKERVLPLVRRVVTEGKPIRSDFLSRPVAIATQEKLSRYLMELQGLRKTATVLMTTEHPFTTHFGDRDVRVTTHYYEKRFISNIFTTLHEGGHALFMQNEPKEFEEEFAADGMSNAMHECISRFYENIVGRSREFIHFVMPKIREVSGDVYADVTEEEFYEAVNIAHPCLIRCEADELTYCLHILVRYELEKAFMNGEITVDEVPRLWNEKYKEYLGLDVPGDGAGCLQDVHWTDDYGYFPSYALGNAYGAQILRTMEKEFDFYGAIAAGDLNKIGDWLKTRVFSIASLCTPDAWIREITGEPLNVDYYLDYLEDKFIALYALEKK